MAAMNMMQILTMAETMQEKDKCVGIWALQVAKETNADMDKVIERFLSDREGIQTVND